MTILDDAKDGMDLSVRPQDDLFGHVNGTWLATVEIPADKSAWGPFAQLADHSEERVHAIIDELAASGHEVGSNAQKIGDLYADFMDEDAVEALGAAPLQPLLQQVYALASIDELPRLVGELERSGIGGPFGSYIDADNMQSDRYLLNITQGGLGLPDESYYRDDKFADIRSAYLVHMSRTFELAGVQEPAGQAQRVMELETELAQGHWARSETRDVVRCYNLTTRDELIAMTPNFDWASYSEGLEAGEKVLAEVNVRQPSYLTHLNDAMERITLEQWRAWLAIRVVRSAAPYLSAALVEEQFDFYGRTLNGTPELRARWKRGVSFVEGCVGEAVGEEYVARHFPPAAKAEMDELVANLLTAYRTSIEALDWMGEDTKQRAYQKLETFMPKIGYPKKFRDYSKLEVIRGDLLANVRAAVAFEHDRQLSKIGTKVDRDEWFMLPQTVNAYYNPGSNEICFPAGILQRPFFDADADPAENYGGIGGVIGHEIGHGFDDQGSKFDHDGNLNEWWTEEDRAAFQERSDKLVKQYDGFSPRSLPTDFVNGALTLGENIGDLGGLTIALKAYRISLGGQAAPERDGLTGDQRVFMNWAYIWRLKRRKEQEQQLLTIDPHSPAEFRANIVRNLDEFHDSFGTTKGDGLWLDPEDRVRIW
ncbi:MAG TPA: M13-type metalloendopeptidase [Nocardioidaceae bacterium]|nr:M13-type metalloendopeptidase [Nocardioidaceae bacterium]